MCVRERERCARAYGAYAKPTGWGDDPFPHRVHAHQQQQLPAAARQMVTGWCLGGVEQREDVEGRENYTVGGRGSVDPVTPSSDRRQCSRIAERKILTVVELSGARLPQSNDHGEFCKENVRKFVNIYQTYRLMR